MANAALMRAVIADDDDAGRDVLRSLLSREPDVEIAGEASSGDEAVRVIAEKKPDLVFMDIEMPGSNGLDALRMLEKPLPLVVFVTAHPEFSLPAFGLPALDYLVKPVERPTFAASVRRARQRLAEARMASLAMLIARSSRALDDAGGSQLPAPPFPEYLAIRARRRLFSLHVDEVFWIQGASQYSRVHAKSGEYLLSRTLASLECELDPQRFFRIHRSAIVNAAHVREIRSCGDGRHTVHLTGGQALPMGRARREVLERLLASIACSQGAGR